MNSNNHSEVKDSKNILKTTDKFKPIDITKLDDLIQDLYMNSSSQDKEIIENIFNENVLEYSSSDRPIPKYAEGTLDAHFLQGGMPLQEKSRDLVNAILSGNYSTIEIEGSVRGSKDVIALFAWSKVLQVHPERVHLALGSSLEHVLRTVLLANGFGLFYTIPHGVFVRETINGAQRGVYKFLDNYGIEKQILFYGNEKENDKNKFQGFTIGTVYVNETLNQHINGLNESENRMASVRQPTMIMTQNPKGKGHRFYVEFERPKLIQMPMIELIEHIRDNFKGAFIELEQKHLKDRDKEKRLLIKTYFKKFSVDNISDLPTKKQIALNEDLLDINYKYDGIIRSYTVQDFYKDIEKGHYLFNKSMKKIVNYVRGGNNPNGIYNAYDFYYAHYTVDDNLAMTEMQRNDFKNKRAKGTSSYEQEVLGLRRSTDGAVYTMFSEDNIFGGDINDFDYTKTERVIVIDKGLNHNNGLIDGEVDFETGTFWQLQESLLDVKAEDVTDEGLETIYLDLLRVIRSRRNRNMPMAVIVDISAVELKTYLKQRNIPVKDAVNNVWSLRGEKEDSHKLQDKDLIGIPFVQTAIAKKKYMVHESNIYTIEQMTSYEAPFDPKTGKNKVNKMNDEFPDCVRYLFNTLIRMAMWEGDETDGSNEKENDTTRVPTDEERERSQRDFYKKTADQIIEAFNQEGHEELSNGFGDFGGEGFWDSSGGFFGN